MFNSLPRFASLERDSRKPAKAGADDGIRTRDLRFTKPLLYRLSYVGKYLKYNILRLRSLFENCLVAN